MDVNHGEYERIYFKERFSYSGLSSIMVENYRLKYGVNVLGKRKKNSIFSKIFKALTEPMILILLFACVITLGVNIGNKMAGKESDFYECVGIIGAIFLSVGLTVFMENKSENAFESLKKLSDSLTVTVVRDNERKIIAQTEVVVGDLICFSSGDKIVADCLIIECNELESEESTLSGESTPVFKKAFGGEKILSENMLYSGTYVKSGNAKGIVLSVGKNAQIGKIASNLSIDDRSIAPLTQKLNKLTKKISIFGAISACFTFLLTLARLYAINGLTFENAKEAFIQAVVLIVAAVPEGLPATVAIALSLSVVKLAKSSAIVKKLLACETVGCVSVICSDKTGTLTMGKMQVSGYLPANGKQEIKKLNNDYVYKNIIYNSTAYFAKEGGQLKCVGNTTEQALISSLFNSNNYQKLAKLRQKVSVVSSLAFNSKRKYMQTEIVGEKGENITYIKGAIEKIIGVCSLDEKEKNKFLSLAQEYESDGKRLIAFAHMEKGNEWVFDGACVISDQIRKEVYCAVKDCASAGIKVKILTGDNVTTATAIAKSLGMLSSGSLVLTGNDIALMSEEQLKNRIDKVVVVARSTPETKLRIVNALKGIGEVVAVTGDGVNDAPAIKNADVGIAMGDGSEITKQTADIVLLNNSFSVIVKAISFGRNIYRNFQRFIFFQLTVNFSAVALVVTFLLLGFEAPFSALQLLWINVIMDGPLALSLGIEDRSDEYMGDSPVKRNASIVSKNTFLRTIIHSALISLVIILQKLYNFMAIGALEGSSVIFSLFVFFQLFNAVNAREIGSESIVKSFGKNKLFSILLVGSMVMQVVLTQIFKNLFTTTSLSFLSWLKIILTAFLIVGVSEFYKLIYRGFKRKTKNNNKRGKFA